MFQRHWFSKKCLFGVTLLKWNENPLVSIETLNISKRRLQRYRFFNPSVHCTNKNMPGLWKQTFDKGTSFQFQQEWIKKKYMTRRKDTNQLWFFQFSFRHFGGTALSTKLGGSGGSFPSDPPQSTAGGTRSANDVRPPCHHYCLYFVLGTSTSNETKHANLVYHEYPSNQLFRSSFRY